MATKRSPTLYIACCSFSQGGKQPSECSFQILVEATTPQNALKDCAAHLQRLRRHEVFADTTQIFLDGLIEIAAVPKAPVLFNYVSHHADNARYVIGNLFPERDVPGLEGYGLQPDDDKERELKPFVTFSKRAPNRKRKPLLASAKR